MKKRKNYTGSDLSSSWKSWVKKEIKRIEKILTDKGCKDLQFNYGFYSFSGFVTTQDGKMYNIFCSDTRGLGEKDNYKELVYRTVTSYSDYSGGCNQRINVDNLENIRL